MTSPPDWVVATSNVPVHTNPPTTGGWESLSQDQLGGLRDNLLRSLLATLLQAVRGLFVPGPLQDVIDQVAEWSADIPVIGDIVEAITGIEDGDLTDLGTWFTTLTDGLWNAFTGHGDTGRPLPDIFAAIWDGITDLFEKVTGQQPGLIPASHIVDASGQNCVTGGDFPTALSVVEGQGWSWDPVVGKRRQGSAKVVANGTERELLSNRIAVVSGDIMTVKASVLWSGLAYTGTDPIVLAVTTYLDSNAMHLQETLVTIPTPAASGGWSDLSYGYVVSDPLVKYVKVRMRIPSNATAGTVWWDELSVTKSGGVRDNSVPGIGTILYNTILGLEDLTGIDINHDGALGALQTTAQALRANSSALSYLWALATGGVSMVDDFERNDSGSMGSNWSQVYSGAGSGVMDTDGHAVNWAKVGLDTYACRARWIGSPSVTNTDKQKIVIVQGSKGQTNATFSKSGYVYVDGRLSVDGTRRIRATFGADGEVALGYYAGGAYVQWVTLDVTTIPGNGSALSLECGVEEELRQYRVLLDDRVIIDHLEVGTASSLGAAYRGVGGGMMAEGHWLLFGQMEPAHWNSWAAWDN